MAALLAMPGVAHAHGGLPPAPHDLWTAWPASYGTAAGLLLLTVVYSAGVRRLRRRAGPSRGLAPWRTAALAGAVVTLALALLTPLDRVAEALFSAHMAQHMLLVAVAAPLLVLARPEVAAAWALPRGVVVGAARWWRRRRVLRAAAHAVAAPGPALLIHIAVLWGWHLPGPYQAALAYSSLHALEHVTMLGAGVLFWRAVVPTGRRAARGLGVVLVLTFVAAMQGAALGALITFASEPWYPAHAPWTGAWGLTPLEDQELAGLIMWVPVGPVYIGAALAALYGWLRAAGPARAPELSGRAARG